MLAIWNTATPFKLIEVACGERSEGERREGDKKRPPTAQIRGNLWVR